MYLTRRATRRWGHPRGVEFIEFAILLPFMLFFITFAIDMGHLTMLQAALQDGTQQVARGGAQNGGWDFLQPAACPNAAQSCTTSSDPWKVMTTSLNETPLAHASNLLSLVSYASPDGTTYGGPYCTGGTSPGANSYIVATATYNASNIFLTPGLYTLMGITLDKFNWTLHATSVARVDVCH
jgi:hypothetical protein